MAPVNLPLWDVARRANHRLDAAAQALAAANHKLARSLAAKLLHRQDVARLGEEDALSAAFLGLCNAARVYREDSGWKFSTLAWRCIVREVLSAARREARHAAVSASTIPGFDAPARPTVEIESDEWPEVKRLLRGQRKRKRKRKRKARRGQPEVTVRREREQAIDLFDLLGVKVYQFDAIRRVACGRRVPSGWRHRRVARYRVRRHRRFQHGRAA